MENGCWPFMEFSLHYRSQKSVKGQAIANFLTDHPLDPCLKDHMSQPLASSVSLVPWTLIFDGASNAEGNGAGVVIISPKSRRTRMAFHLNYKCTNNQAEYEALIIGLEVLLEMGAIFVHINSDSNLVTRQLSGEFRVKS